MSGHDGAPLIDVCGVVDLSGRGLLEMHGDDAMSILHKFCTNDIQNLAIDAGCEAFVLDAKGHIQFYVIVHRRSDRLVLEVLSVPDDADCAARLLKFVDRYVMREKVKFVDRTADWGELLVAGEGAAECVSKALSREPPRDAPAGFAAVPLGDAAFVAKSIQSPSPNFSLIGARAEVAAAYEKLAAAGVVRATREGYEAARIAAGLPLLGADIKEKALAQEVDRNERTINFRKGCYLGQETVARLDALGHVNKTLVRLEFASASPTPGMELRSGEQVVGTVTSAAPLQDGKYVALGIVRAGSNRAGTTLDSAAGPAIVLRL